MTLQVPIAARATPAMLDVVRGLAMVIVLYGHVLEVLFLDRPDGVFTDGAFVQYKALSSFVMPLFFLVSGISAANIVKKSWPSVARTSVYLLVLAYLVHASGLAVMVVETAFTGTGGYLALLDYGVQSTLKGRSFSTIVIWFLVSLAIVRLIVYVLFRTLPRRKAWVAIALIALSTALVPLLPNPFMLRTWSVGIVFFAAGMALAPWSKRPLPLAALLLGPLVVGLALVNRGCPYDPFATCVVWYPPMEAVTWVHDGKLGFIPLFFLTAGLGCIFAIALAQQFVRARPAGLVRLLARMGKNTLELLILNGFILAFVQPPLKRLPIGEVAIWVYPLILAGIIALHLILLIVFERPLAALQKLAFRISDRALRRLVPLAERLNGKVATRVN